MKTKKERKKLQKLLNVMEQKREEDKKEPKAPRYKDEYEAIKMLLYKCMGCSYWFTNDFNGKDNSKYCYYCGYYCLDCAEKDKKKGGGLDFGGDHNSHCFNCIDSWREDKPNEWEEIEKIFGRKQKK